LKKVIFIIYVKNQQISTEFYRKVLGNEPVLNVPGMTEFMVNENTNLGIMPEKGIAKILGSGVPHPESGNGIPRCEIYFKVDNPQEYLDRLVSSGGNFLSSAAPRAWGDEAAYGADPDGHILAFAREIR
jgi:predicted enzyme related to lactoylglutathione lyase